jgi:hypothetical protein
MLIIILRSFGRGSKHRRRAGRKSMASYFRYYRIAGIIIEVESELPFTEETFLPKFKAFEVAGPGEDTIHIRHHFSIPDEILRDPGKRTGGYPPWTIFAKDDRWVYVAASEDPDAPRIYQAAVFTRDYARGDIYHPDSARYLKGGIHSLTLSPTDQIFLAPALAARDACYLHASGVIYKERGLLFLGHSEAGKSTMVKMMRDRSEILCDDRVIVRRWPEGFRVHGTWSHGEVPDVSPGPAMLKAIFLLVKDVDNGVQSEDKRAAFRHLMDCLIKPFATADWWDRTLSLGERLASEVPFYRLRFDMSGKVLGLLDAI